MYWMHKEIEALGILKDLDIPFSTSTHVLDAGRYDSFYHRHLEHSLLTLICARQTDERQKPLGGP
jgi:hypothetical protein